MSADEKVKTIKLRANENLSTLFVDVLAINKREDGMYYLRFATNLPEGWKEQARMIIPEGNLKQMLNALCSLCDYYPVKSVKKESNSS